MYGCRGAVSGGPGPEWTSVRPQPLHPLGGEERSPPLHLPPAEETVGPPPDVVRAATGDADDPGVHRVEDAAAPGPAPVAPWGGAPEVDAVVFTIPDRRVAPVDLVRWGPSEPSPTDLEPPASVVEGPTEDSTTRVTPLRRPPSPGVTVHRGPRG